MPTTSPAEPATRTRDAVRTRAALLAAARAVVAKQGGHVSLDAVAKEAGVSKGGLLHHFPSREALLVGLVDEWLEEYERTVQRHLDDEQEGRPGRIARAHVRATLDLAPEYEGWDVPALMGLMVSTPDVLGRARQMSGAWLRDLTSDGLDPDRARLVWLALDGVTMQEIFGHWSDPAERAALRDQLIAMTEEG